jgi:hypothetical protein
MWRRARTGIVRGIAWPANRLAIYGQRIKAGHGDKILAGFGPVVTVGCYFA